jgi:succinate dehydrogenase/fumarate reductase flavoprotein subunit
MTERFDHIVVGGGSSGCVAAARLAEAGRRVLLWKPATPTATRSSTCRRASSR